MEIKLDADAVAGIASAAIFDSLSQEARESMIKQAIEFLLTPERDRNRFSHGKTPLQVAFDTAIHQACMKVVQEHVADDPVIKAHILELLGPLITPALKTTAANYDSRLSDALGSALSHWLSEIARDQ